METMTSMERVLTTLSHKEPDRVPFFLLLTMHGAKELGLSIEEYFSKPENIVEGQLRLREKYQHDCYYPFTYAAVEVEAFGGDVKYVSNGPPNAGSPIIKNRRDIEKLKVPDVKNTPCLRKALNTIELLKVEAGEDVPIIGVVVSPFSLPVMQMGFPDYLDLLLHDKESFYQLMAVNELFCVQWANAQLAAGATAICYFDPVASPSMVPASLYRKSGLDVAKRTLPQINGLVATHFASGTCLEIIEDVVSTGTGAVGVGEDEDINELKEKSRGRLSLIGNLNGIKMCSWPPQEARSSVTDLLSKAAPGGGFILADGHGEIPWQVPDEVLHAMSTTVRQCGTYPITSPEEIRTL
ncbi:MAG: uroporphyrinogen decarboxylase [Desulforhopalus sp.]|jgi:uroporphyrinogen decarboxylase